MAKYPLTWIDRDAQEGPLFRIGSRDTYYRERAGQRIVRLKARHSPDLHYLQPAVEAFRTLAIHWGAPVIFVIDPDVKKPPAAQFLYEWSQAAHRNNSVDHSFMLMHSPVSHVLGRFVCRMFCEAGMPFEAISGEARLTARLDEMNTAVGWSGWSISEEQTALVVRRRVGEGAYGQLLVRMMRRLRGPRSV